MGLTQRGAATALGVTLATYQALERGAAFATGKPVGIDRRTALACAALAAGLQAWGDAAIPASDRPWGLYRHDETLSVGPS